MRKYLYISRLLIVSQYLYTVITILSRCSAEGDELFMVKPSSLTQWSGTDLSIEAKAWIAERTVRRLLIAEFP